MNRDQNNSIYERLAPEQQARKLILLAFREPFPRECSELGAISTGQWQNLLRWLDTSGMALYFLDRLQALERTDLLPANVKTRLEQNLADNAVRTASLMKELGELHIAFQEKRISYLLLKGCSLFPDSVPRLELRSQLDLDFLVHAADAHAVRLMLERRGYQLHATNGSTWEFKTGTVGRRSLNDLYKPTPYRSIELHLQHQIAGRPSKLDQAEVRTFQKVSLPVLGAAELFVWQGLHLFKHICSAFTRTAHLLEFRRHIIARRHDLSFWRQIERCASNDARTIVGLGIATAVATHVIDEFAPAALTSWTVERLPDAVQGWVERYADPALLGSFPGNKLYLLLNQQLEAIEIRPARSRRAALIPLKLPPPISFAAKHESLAARLKRCRAEFAYVLFRLRFHLVEGARYLYEAFRWRRHLRASQVLRSEPKPRITDERITSLWILLATLSVVVSAGRAQAPEPDQSPSGQSQATKSSSTKPDQSTAPRAFDLNGANPFTGSSSLLIGVQSTSYIAITAAVAGVI